jgi:ubiquinone/menaquinone biosynthesis C-methylase UbiE
MNEDYVQLYASLERKHWWFLVRKKIILQSIRQHLKASPPVSLSILNVGAAGGASSDWLATFGTVVSLETDPLFLSYLRDKKIAVVEGSVDQLPFPDQSFDLVCAFDVLEHVENDQRAMSELNRVCKPGGMIGITVPALNMLWSYHDELNDHYRRYSRSTLKALIEKFPGQKILQLQYFNSLLFLPVLATRKISNLFSKQKKSGQSDFTFFKTGPLVNKLLETIFGLELKLMQWFKFPAGVSLLAILQKDQR